MTYNEKLREIASKGGAIPYIYGTDAEADQIVNKIYKSAQFPICVHFVSTAGRFFPFPQIREEREVSIGFADLMKFRQFTAEGVEEKLEALRATARDFLRRLNEDGFFEPVEDVSYVTLFDDDSANMVVLLLSFTLREASGRCD